MYNAKERVFGAITVMTEQDASKVWNFIQNNFTSWDDIEVECPDETDLQMLSDIKSNLDCKSFVSSDDLYKSLSL